MAHVPGKPFGSPGKRSSNRKFRSNKVGIATPQMMELKERNQLSGRPKNKPVRLAWEESSAIENPGYSDVDLSDPPPPLRPPSAGQGRLPPILGKAEKPQKPEHSKNVVAFPELTVDRSKYKPDTRSLNRPEYIEMQPGVPLAPGEAMALDPAVPKGMSETAFKSGTNAKQASLPKPDPRVQLAREVDWYDQNKLRKAPPRVKQEYPPNQLEQIERFDRSNLKNVPTQVRPEYPPNQLDEIEKFGQSRLKRVPRPTERTLETPAQTAAAEYGGPPARPEAGQYSRINDLAGSLREYSPEPRRLNPKGRTAPQPPLRAESTSYGDYDMADMSGPSDFEEPAPRRLNPKGRTAPPPPQFGAGSTNYMGYDMADMPGPSDFEEPRAMPTLKRTPPPKPAPYAGPRVPATAARGSMSPEELAATYTGVSRPLMPKTRSAPQLPRAAPVGASGRTVRDVETQTPRTRTTQAAATPRNPSTRSVGTNIGTTTDTGMQADPYQDPSPEGKPPGFFRRKANQAQRDMGMSVPGDDEGPGGNGGGNRTSWRDKLGVGAIGAGAIGAGVLGAGAGIGGGLLAKHYIDEENNRDNEPKDLDQYEEYENYLNPESQLAFGGSVRSGLSGLGRSAKAKVKSLGHKLTNSKAGMAIRKVAEQAERDFRGTQDGGLNQEVGILAKQVGKDFRGSQGSGLQKIANQAERDLRPNDFARYAEDQANTSLQNVDRTARQIEKDVRGSPAKPTVNPSGRYNVKDQSVNLGPDPEYAATEMHPMEERESQFARGGKVKRAKKAKAENRYASGGRVINGCATKGLTRGKIV